MFQFIIFFTIIQFINVMLNTFKTIITTRGNKIFAALINAITFGFYTVVVVYTANNFSLLTKIIITFFTNLIGVYLSIWILEKLRKDKLWEITATIKFNSYNECDDFYHELDYTELSYNSNTTNRDDEIVFHIYSKNQKESAKIKPLLTKYNAKYIIHEQNIQL